MKEEAKARTIPPGEMRGASISLSNFGVLGVKNLPSWWSSHHRSPLSVPAVLKKNWRSSTASLWPKRSLSFDHRVVTGGEAARFLVALVADLSRP